MLKWLESLLPRIVVNFLARAFKDWRRDGSLRDLGAAEQSNRAAVEVEKRGRESDEIERQIETATEDELVDMIKGKK